MADSLNTDFRSGVDSSADGTLDPYGAAQLGDLTDEQLLGLRETLANLITAREARAAAFIAAAGNKPKRVRGPNKNKTTDASATEVRAAANK